MTPSDQGVDSAIEMTPCPQRVGMATEMTSGARGVDMTTKRKKKSMVKTKTYKNVG